MKLQKTTLALLAIAVALGGAVIVAENRRDPQQAAVDQAQGASSPVFTFEESAVTGLHIETDGQAVTFERDDQGLWQMTAPEPGPAEEAAIAFLLSRLTTDGLTQTLTMAGTDQEAFGLAVPFATVDLTLADGTTHQVILGGSDFSGEGIYALVDPETFPIPDDAEAVPVALLSLDIRNGVDRPLVEWQAVTDAPTDSAPTDIPSQDDPPVDAPAETLPLPPAPEVPGSAE
ncbi:MAG: hypothetical protein VKJ09_12450 [Leptolyngbya sp.]|nr:hypothetical protein [Leptolyngbya sp.]